jgi:hypothetical protein
VTRSLLVLALAACSTKDAAAPASAPARRIVAIGDLHGDLAATRAALRLAGAIGGAPPGSAGGGGEAAATPQSITERDRWIGGALIVVQVGDQLDRGDDEPEILDLLDRLAEEARAAGGAVIVLNGNHELMQADADFRYVTREGFEDFGGAEARTAAFRPGGALARRLARRPIYAIVDGNVFAHGGILPEHVRYGLPRLDTETRAWLAGEGPRPAAAMDDPESPVWTRRYGLDPADCAAAAEALRALGARRHVVGHTTQERGANSTCDGTVWRIDVGLARHYMGPIQVLEIAGDSVKVLSAPRP